MILTTGYPKSGNHALVKAVQLLGQPCDVNHTPFIPGLEVPRIVVRRDPRNVVLSWLRFNGQPQTPGMFLTAFRHMQHSPLVEELAAFEGWLSDPGALLVSYERLVADDSEMRRIASYLGVPYIEDAWRWLPGLTRTWNAVRSDWNAVWTDEVQAAWNNEGGPALLARWGY